MGKMVTWVLSFTKIGKAVDPVRKFISGKGTYLSAVAAGIPALVLIVQKFAEQGLPYLSTMMTSQEWLVLCGALATIRMRLAITKAADPSKDPNAVLPSGKVSG